jgi:hypothetical protein
VRELLILVFHLLVTAAKLLRPGGVRAVAAESLLLKHQLLISNRSRRRASSLSAVDRFVLGLTTLFVRPHRIRKLGALINRQRCSSFTRPWWTGSIGSSFRETQFETQLLRPLDKAHTLHGSGSIAVLPTGRLRRLVQQPAPLVVPDRLHVDACLFGQAPDGEFTCRSSPS